MRLRTIGLTILAAAVAACSAPGTGTTGVPAGNPTPVVIGAPTPVPGAPTEPPAPPVTPSAVRAPLFDDLGSYSRKVTTRSAQAQRYFDQGLILGWGFNHAEAERSFREAARLDPECAMCWWGVAWVLGPNINAAMEGAAAAPAYEASRKALALASKVSPGEAAWVRALSRRYAEKPPEDRKPLDRAFADAMREVSRQNPDDLDAATVFAESLLDLAPWTPWNKDGTPTEWTPEILRTIEGVLARNPRHPGAIHLYIHAVEASKDPGRAEEYAVALPDLAPGAGHLVHMPSHIQIRTGRYEQVIALNERASKADDSYIAQCHAQGVYPLGYVNHNVHMGWAGAVMIGRRDKAMELAHSLHARMEHAPVRDDGMGTLQHYSAIPLWTLVRFGDWEAILREPAPASDLAYPNAIWRWARGMALVARGETDAARAELAKIREIVATGAIEPVTIWEINKGSDIVAIAMDMLEGQIAARAGNTERAVASLRQAVEREDALNYNEPPDWYPPVRPLLGAVLRGAGKPKDAEAVYRRDLEINPENGWSLDGLARSLAAQGRQKEAAEVQARFARVWKGADASLGVGGN
jgi:tetratricopeptide (TPR) repeat protein